MAKSTSKKCSWYYWMYRYAKETGYGSSVPDFDHGKLTEKQFNKTMHGQTISKLSKEEMKELEGISNGIWPKIWKKRRCNFCGKWFLGWSRFELISPWINPIHVVQTKCSSKCQNSFRLAIGKLVKGEEMTKQEKKATKNLYYLDIHIPKRQIKDAAEKRKD